MMNRSRFPNQASEMLGKKPKGKINEGKSILKRVFISCLYASKYLAQVSSRKTKTIGSEKMGNDGRVGSESNEETGGKRRKGKYG